MALASAVARDLRNCKCSTPPSREIATTPTRPVRMKATKTATTPLRKRDDFAGMCFIAVFSFRSGSQFVIGMDDVLVSRIGPTRPHSGSQLYVTVISTLLPGQLSGLPDWLMTSGQVIW